MAAQGLLAITGLSPAFPTSEKKQENPQRLVQRGAKTTTGATAEALYFFSRRKILVKKYDVFYLATSIRVYDTYTIHRRTTMMTKLHNTAGVVAG